MKTLLRIILVSVTLLAGVSCGKTTEKYAQKEHGKQFGSWELNYNAGDYDVYWPSLVLSEKVKGGLFEVKTDRNWWTGKVISSDTTRSAALLGAKIISVKSKNDAKYYDSISFQVSNTDKKYRPNLEHRFVFNEGQKDSLSFSMTANKDDNFVPSREIADQIIQLLTGRKPIDVKVIFQGTDIAGEYSFEVEGCPKLKQGLELNQERKIIANKEFNKADRKATKEFLDLFE